MAVKNAHERCSLACSGFLALRVVFDTMPHLDLAYGLTANQKDNTRSQCPGRILLYHISTQCIWDDHQFCDGNYSREAYLDERRCAVRGVHVFALLDVQVPFFWRA